MTYDELVIDTNVLLSDASALKKLNQVNINIPFVVLQELDNHKTDLGEVGLNARATIKYLENLCNQGDIRKGVKTETGSLLRILPELIDCQLSPDDQIIQSAKEIGKKSNVSLISNDFNVRVKASVFGIKTEEYRSDKVVQYDSDLYSGITTEKLEPDLIDKLYAKSFLEIDGSKFQPNQFIQFIDKVNNKHTAIGRITDKNIVSKMHNVKSLFGVKPRNLEQSCALDILLDMDVPLVTIMGKAGSGKTLLSLIAALDSVVNQGAYQKIVIMRPPIAMGKDIGYLPGTLREKMGIWMGPIMDNFEMLLGPNKITLDYLIDNGTIEIAPPSHIRGRSLAHSFVIIDEAQNLNLHEMKTIITRLHESSKLVLTGDVHQIDVQNLSSVDNGLSIVIDAFKKYSLAGHITLEKCERGSLAALAAEIL